MDIIKSYISILYNSNIVIEFEDETWIRIVEEKGRYSWYNSVSDTYLYFHKPNECYRFIELSAAKDKIYEVVYNSPRGNVLVYRKEIEETDNSAAELLLTLSKR